MKTILYVSPSSGIGGVETFLTQLCKYSDNSKFRNIFLLFGDGPLLDALKKQKATVEVLPRRPRLSHPKDWLYVSQFVQGMIDRYNIQLVHASQSYAALFTALPSKVKKCPHIWFQHGPTSGWMDQLAAILYHQGIVSNSHFTASQQEKLEGKVKLLLPKKRNNQTIHLGTEVLETNTDKTKKIQLLKEYNLDEDTKIISMLCRIQHWKGPHLAIDAFRKLKNMNIKTKAHLFIWGEAFKGDNYYKSLVKTCQDSRLPVSFPGPIDSPRQTLAMSDLLINASVEPEPFGLTIVEAMSVGTPPLVPDEGGPKEIVKWGVNGMLFKPRSSDSLAENLKNFITNSELQESLSRGALNSAKKDFRIDRTIAKLEEYHLGFISH